MPERTQQKSTKTVEFSNLGRRVVEGRFDGASMTSDGGVMLLNETDRKLGLTQAAARCIPDPRSPLLITHAVRDMLRQRVYGLALGSSTAPVLTRCAQRTGGAQRSPAPSLLAGANFRFRRPKPDRPIRSGSCGASVSVSVNGELFRPRSTWSSPRSESPCSCQGQTPNSCLPRYSFACSAGP